MTTATRKKPSSNGSKPVKPREIAILGYAEETRDLVFALDENVEIWGINMAHAFIWGKDGPKTKAKVTNWFQLHPRNWSSGGRPPTGYFGRPKEHVDFLSKFDGTVWMQKADPEIPNSKPYPLAEITVASGRQYFTSTFAFQLGLIWYQHVIENNPVKSVRVYGVNLTSMDEYIHQKSCVEYWLGRLEQAGIEVLIPSKSALMKGKLYAYSEGDLSDFAFEKLQFAKGKYTEAWANTNTSMSMMAEIKFWAAALSQLAEKHQFNDEVKNDIQSVFDKRSGAVKGLIDQSISEVNGWMGQVKAQQEWLAITGGVDHRAPQLPELRLPNPRLSGEFEIPKPQAI